MVAAAEKLLKDRPSRHKATKYPEDKRNAQCVQALNALTESLELIFGRWVDEGTVSAIAMFSNVRVKETADSEGFDAVHVGYEHQVGYSVNAFYPYALTGGAVEFGDVTGEFRESTVFVDGG